MRISDFFENHYRVKRLRGRAPNTLRLYRRSIRLMDATLMRPATLEDFNDDNIALVMQSVLDRGGSPFTANKERSQLLAIWRFAAQLKKVDTWPTIQAEREPERVPVAWLADDVHKLFAAIESLTDDVGEVPARIWWKALVTTCLDTGERIGAVFQAEWSWLERQWFKVPAEARKFRKRGRSYLLSDETLDNLDQMRKYRTGDKIFEWPYCSTYLWRKYKNVLIEAGLPHGPKDSFHRIRKTCGSVAHAAGLDVQEVLDHESRRTSKKYIDPRFNQAVQPSHVLAAWLRNPPPQQQTRKQA